MSGIGDRLMFELVVFLACRPVGGGGPGPLLPPSRPKKRRPVPTLKEIAWLPRGTQAAFAVRCALRVQPLVQLDPNGEDVVGAAAVAILRASDGLGDLMALRRDYRRLKRLANANGWTNDTPVPQEVFGPMWPKGREPLWARETNKPRE